jgi:hypothetical protein
MIGNPTVAVASTAVVWDVSAGKFAGIAATGLALVALVAFLDRRRRPSARG